MDGQDPEAPKRQRARKSPAEDAAGQADFEPDLTQEIETPPKPAAAPRVTPKPAAAEFIRIRARRAFHVDARDLPEIDHGGSVEIAAGETCLVRTGAALSLISTGLCDAV